MALGLGVFCCSSLFSVASAGPLVDRGISLLQANRAAEARDAFTQSLSKEGESVDALNGLGVALMELKQLPRSQQMLEKAMTLEPGNRSVVNNLAAARYQSGEPMRAAQLVASHLADASRPLDAELFFSLRVAMRLVPDRSRRGKMWDEIERTAVAYELKLNNAVEGMTLWGQQWISIDERSRFEQRNREAETEMAELDKQLKLANEELAKARANLQQVIRTTSANDPFGVANRDEAMSEVDLAERNVRLAQGQAHDVSRELNVVSWPGEIAIVPIKSRTPARLPRPLRPTTTPTSRPATRSTTQTVVAAPQDVAQARASAQSTQRFASAFAVGPRTLVTSALAVRGATDVRLIGPDGVIVLAKVERIDARLDLAVLSVDAGQVSPMPLLEPGRAIEPGPAVCESFPKLDLRRPRSTLIGMTISIGDKQQLLLMGDRSPRLSGGPLLVGETVVGAVLVEFENYRLIPAAAIRALVNEAKGKIDSKQDEGLPSVLLIVATHATAK